METEKMVTESTQWTPEKLAAFNKGRRPHQQMIRVINPNTKIKERYVSRKNFEKTLRKEGWFEIGADENIAQHLMKNRPKTPAELVLEEENERLRVFEEENERLKAEMAALRNGTTTTQAPQPPTFALNTNPGFNLERTVPEITAEVNTIERVATLNEIMSAEVAGQNRKGVLSAIENRINEIGK